MTVSNLIRSRARVRPTPSIFYKRDRAASGTPKEPGGTGWCTSLLAGSGTCRLKEVIVRLKLGLQPRALVDSGPLMRKQGKSVRRSYAAEPPFFAAVDLLLLTGSGEPGSFLFLVGVLPLDAS
jgi:hypothetical protein